MVGGDELDRAALKIYRWDTKRDCCGEVNGGSRRRGLGGTDRTNCTVGDNSLRLAASYRTTHRPSYVEERSGRLAEGDPSDQRSFPAPRSRAWAIGWKVTPNVTLRPTGYAAGGLTVVGGEEIAVL